MHRMMLRYALHMKAFFYFDNSKAEWHYPCPNELHGKWISPVIFWIEKESILEADAEINKALNIKVEKKANISCQIFSIKHLDIQ